MELNKSAMLICLLSLSAFLSMAPETSAFKTKFYLKSCPSAENVVRKVVKNAVEKDPTITAGLIRLLFHDCFVRGCDASILLKSTAKNVTELGNPVSSSLRGLDVIDKAKAKLEAKCPGIVSCADIIAFAARDSSYISGGIFYRVPSGRRDGTISIASEVLKTLPNPFLTVEQLIQFFAKKGMSKEEMVALSGAHSIGVAQCPTILPRLYTFNNSKHRQDPSLDPKFANFLKKKCPKGVATGNVNLDDVTPNRLDNEYYKVLKKNKGVLITDQELTNSPLTAKIVEKYVNYPQLWADDFAAAMVHLGNIDVLTGNEGEIRKKCGVVNW